MRQPDSIEAAFWRAAADRRAANDEPATAIMFRNIAYILEHPDTWADNFQVDIPDDVEVRP